MVLWLVRGLGSILNTSPCSVLMQDIVLKPAPSSSDNWYTPREHPEMTEKILIGTVSRNQANQRMIEGGRVSIWAHRVC